MGFNENAFVIAGTAIAIGGVGLYIWDTRKSSFQSAVSSGYGSLTNNASGGSKKTRRKHNNHRKTRKY